MTRCRPARHRRAPGRPSFSLTDAGRAAHCAIVYMIRALSSHESETGTNMLDVIASRMASPWNGFSPATAR